MKVLIAKNAWKLYTTHILVFFIFFPSLIYEIWIHPLENGVVQQDEQKLIFFILNGIGNYHLNDPFIFHFYRILVDIFGGVYVVPYIINTIFVIFQINLLYKIARSTYSVLFYFVLFLPYQQVSLIYGPTKDIIICTIFLFYYYKLASGRDNVIVIMLTYGIVALFKPLFLPFLIILYIVIHNYKYQTFMIMLCVCFFITLSLALDLRYLLGGYHLNFQTLGNYLQLKYSAIYGNDHSIYSVNDYIKRVVAYVIGPLHEPLEYDNDFYYVFQNLLFRLASVKFIFLLIIVTCVALLKGRINIIFLYIVIFLAVITLMYFGVNYRYRCLAEVFLAVCVLREWARFKEHHV